MAAVLPVVLPIVATLGTMALEKAVEWLKDFIPKFCNALLRWATKCAKTLVAGFKKMLGYFTGWCRSLWNWITGRVDPRGPDVSATQHTDSSAQAYVDAARRRINSSAETEAQVLTGAFRNFVKDTENSTDVHIQQLRVDFMTADLPA